MIIKLLNLCFFICVPQGQKIVHIFIEFNVLKKKNDVLVFLKNLMMACWLLYIAFYKAYFSENVDGSIFNFHLLNCIILYNLSSLQENCSN